MIFVMAATTVLSDDFEPTITTDVQTVSYAFKGKAYTIDLGPENLKQFEEEMQAYIDVSRPDTGAISGSKRGRGAGRPASAGGSDASAIREWALQNGLKAEDGGDLPKRGRIPAHIREAYEKAHAA